MLIVNGDFQVGAGVYGDLLKCVLDAIFVCNTDVFLAPAHHTVLVLEVVYPASVLSNIHDGCESISSGFIV